MVNRICRKWEKSTTMMMGLQHWKYGNPLLTTADHELSYALYIASIEKQAPSNMRIGCDIIRSNEQR